MSISVPYAAITDGPAIVWNHVDGPLLEWAGYCHWLTLRERISLAFGLTTVSAIAERRWPQLAIARSALTGEKQS